MRALLSITLLLAVILIAGCSHSGDFGAFVVAQVTKYGGHTRTTGTIPQLDARWTIKQDANGFTAYVSDAPFSVIDGFMRDTFGAPKISTDANLDGEPQRVWGAVDLGVAIQLIGHKNDSEIICVRGGP